MAKEKPVWIDAEKAIKASSRMSAEEWGRTFHGVMEKLACGDPVVPIPEWLSLTDPYDDDDDATR